MREYDVLILLYTDIIMLVIEEEMNKTSTNLLKIKQQSERSSFPLMNNYHKSKEFKFFTN